LGRVNGTPGSEATLVADILARSGVGKSELCRRCGVSRSLLDSYLKGAKAPSLGQLRRLADAAGLRVVVTLTDAAGVDPVRAAALLRQVCETAEHLPRRAAGPLRYPPLRTLAAR
jgi:transcriptional regulator with XRE-family HTH domain